jgi:hypothetical protein
VNLQARARLELNQAVSRGLIHRECCEVCGSEPTEGHHEDYSQPLEVRWLCKRHHRWLHLYRDTVEDLCDALASFEARGGKPWTWLFCEPEELAA